MRYIIPFALLLSRIVCCLALLQGPTPKTSSPPESIALHEAEILIYLLPAAHETRKQGMDIGWELETNPPHNTEDFYAFWVVNAKRPRHEGSVTIGYFKVNKHTADILDDFDKPVVTEEIEGVQRILRMAHHIDQGTLTTYRARRPLKTL